MGTSTEGGSANAPQPPHDDSKHESLTDLIDRMDRESFHRALQQRDLRLLSSDLRRR